MAVEQLRSTRDSSQQPATPSEPDKTETKEPQKSAKSQSKMEASNQASGAMQDARFQELKSILDAATRHGLPRNAAEIAKFYKHITKHAKFFKRAVFANLIKEAKRKGREFIAQAEDTEKNQQFRRAIECFETAINEQTDKER